MYWTALIIGFLGNFHCIGMCGPIVLSLPIGKLSPGKKIASILLYNAGRIFAYSIIGGTIGIFGLGLRYIGIAQILSILSGISLLLIGLFSLPTLKFKIFHVPSILVSSVQKKVVYFIKNKNWKFLFFVGFFNGFLPCGLVYAALAGSLVTASWFGGILYMILFGLGTLPLMLFIPYLSSIITPSIRSKMHAVSSTPHP